MPGVKPRAFWLFGLSGAGKSTLAASVVDHLRGTGRPVLALDGDILRQGLCSGLGYSDGDRTENLRRAAETAKLALGSGLHVVASFITPLQSHRELVARIIGRDLISLIYLDAPFDVCRRRDRKGLYAAADRGEVQQVSGVTSAFEIPAEADLTVPSATADVAACAGRLRIFVETHLPGTKLSAT